MCKLLCAAGADPNYTRPGSVHRCPDFPLWICLNIPAVVHVLLRFGADPSRKGSDSGFEDMVTPEEEALREASDYYEREEVSPSGTAAYLESAGLLADARMLRPRLRGIFVLRTLVVRGRSVPTARTPSTFARLVGGNSALASRPRTRGAKLLASPGLLDPLAHLVCKFWLGSPPRRARPAAAPSSGSR